MRFYGWDWRTTMKTPISAFWTCYRHIDRLRAEEALERLVEIGLPHMEPHSREEYVQGLQDRIGTVVVEKPVFDASGWNALKEASHHLQR